MEDPDGNQHGRPEGQHIVSVVIFSRNFFFLSWVEILTHFNGKIYAESRMIFNTVLLEVCYLGLLKVLINFFW